MPPLPFCAARRALQAGGLGAQRLDALDGGVVLLGLVLHAVVQRGALPAFVAFGVAARVQPGAAQVRQTAADVDGGGRVAVGARGVVHRDALAVGEQDLAHGHVDARQRAGHMHLARGREGLTAERKLVGKREFFRGRSWRRSPGWMLLTQRKQLRSPPVTTCTWPGSPPQAGGRQTRSRRGPGASHKGLRSSFAGTSRIKFAGSVFQPSQRQTLEGRVHPGADAQCSRRIGWVALPWWCGWLWRLGLKAVISAIGCCRP